MVNCSLIAADHRCDRGELGTRSMGPGWPRLGESGDRALAPHVWRKCDDRGSPACPLWLVTSGEAYWHFWAAIPCDDAGTFPDGFDAVALRRGA